MYLRNSYHRSESDSLPTIFSNNFRNEHSLSISILSTVSNSMLPHIHSERLLHFTFNKKNASNIQFKNKYNKNTSTINNFHVFLIVYHSNVLTSRLLNCFTTTLNFSKENLKFETCLIDWKKCEIVLIFFFV